MKITIKLFATLREGRFEIAEREFAESTPVSSVIKTLGLKKGEVTIIFLNGCHAQPGQKLKDGDVLALFPPVGGG